MAEFCRARAVALQSSGWSVGDMAEAVDVTAAAVYGWLKRLGEGGVEALRDRGRPGRPPTYDDRFLPRVPAGVAFARPRLESHARPRHCLLPRNANGLRPPGRGRGPDRSHLVASLLTNPQPDRASPESPEVPLPLPPFLRHRDGSLASRRARIEYAHRRPQPRLRDRAGKAPTD
ncbi:MAG: helix-turn-helix domain-containing protein [Planctomycetia bacterium]|nr:helix-turn-helix domain-containing protein [Planctomycetia bacterium]